MKLQSVRHVASSCPHHLPLERHPMTSFRTARFVRHVALAACAVVLGLTHSVSAQDSDTQWSNTPPQSALPELGAWVNQPDGRLAYVAHFGPESAPEIESLWRQFRANLANGPSGLAFYRNKSSAKADSNEYTKPAFTTASGHLFGVGALMYEFWFPTAQQNTKTMLLVGEKMDELNSEMVLSRATPIGDIKTISTWKNGKQTGTYYYRLVGNYRGQASKLTTDDAGSD